MKYLLLYVFMLGMLEVHSQLRNEKVPLIIGDETDKLVFQDSTVTDTLRAMIVWVVNFHNPPLDSLTGKARVKGVSIDQLVLRSSVKKYISRFDLNDGKYTESEIKFYHRYADIFTPIALKQPYERVYNEEPYLAFRRRYGYIFKIVPLVKNE